MLNDDPFRGEDGIKFCTVIRGLSLRISADLERKAKCRLHTNLPTVQGYRSLLYSHWSDSHRHRLLDELEFLGPPYLSRAMPAVVEYFGG